MPLCRACFLGRGCARRLTPCSRSFPLTTPSSPTLPLSSDLCIPKKPSSLSHRYNVPLLQPGFLCLFYCKE